MKLCQNCGQPVAEEITTCPSCGSEIAEGIKRIDNYLIEEVLHEGHASILCRAVKEGETKPVMIRIFTPQSGVSKDVADRLKGELEELKKLQTLEMNAQENLTCMGLLLGRNKFEHESASEFKNWAQDSPIIFAEMVVYALKIGTLTKADVDSVRAFIEDELGGWGAGLV